MEMKVKIVTVREIIYITEKNIYQDEYKWDYSPVINKNKNKCNWSHVFIFLLIIGVCMTLLGVTKLA